MNAAPPTPLPENRQPLLHDAVITLRAPVQVWSRADGSMRAPIDGIYLGDTRLADGLALEVGGEPGEHIATLEDAADTTRFVSLHRGLDSGRVADPDVRGTLERRVTGGTVSFSFRLASRLDAPITTEVVLRLRPRLDRMDDVKSGAAAASKGPAIMLEERGAAWEDGTVHCCIEHGGAGMHVDGEVLELRWTLTVPARGEAAIAVGIGMHDAAAVVAEPDATADWRIPAAGEVADDRVGRWLDRALGDLDALRLVRRDAAGAVGADQFLAAGAPWFFTLFGRDSLWAARLLLPLGPGIAASTLRVLAGLQGRERVAATAEQPGKIMHELRRTGLEIPAEGVSLPPLYYGTVDATPLWIATLADARDAGMPDVEVEALLPYLEAALAWLRDFGDSDGDGLLEYVDETGTGLSNQGWKDSGDSVQWRDGTLATGPIALCEVQAYAYEAAMRGADLLEAFGRPGASEWRNWAERLATRFRAAFWLEDADGRYPAIALDADKRPVDSVTSNIGHLLGTGLLAADEEAEIARRLVSPALDSGFGLRTLATTEAGYWPLGYHGGSVWAHDTAIAIRGLVRAGFRAEAAQLGEGLLRAAAAFGYRMPELHSGDAATEVPVPAPYPAACRPQAWSAAAVVTVRDALR